MYGGFADEHVGAPGRRRTGTAAHQDVSDAPDEDVGAPARAGADEDVGALQRLYGAAALPTTGSGRCALSS